MDLREKRVLVVGMQASGISAAYLARREGATVTYYDDNQFGKIGDFDKTEYQNFDDMVKTSDYIIVSPSISKYHPLIVACNDCGKKVLSELEFGFSFLNCKTVAVTGTNGKTTCVTMMEKLLNFAGIKAKAMGNIGYPVSQVVLDGTTLDWAIIEVSSFQLEHIDAFRPDISVVLNLAPDHLDRYDDYNDYINAKRNICVNQSASDYVIFNNEDGIARSFIKSTLAKPIAVSTRAKLSNVYIKDNFYMYDDTGICHVKECRLRGEHNRFNLLIAMNVGFLCGVRKEHMAKLVREYCLLPNRVEYVTTIDGKNYYNDSKGTNIHACRNAIDSLDGTIGLIMGGSDKNEDFCDFFENIDSRVKNVAITGGNAEKIYNSAMKMGFPDAQIFPDLKSCVEFLSHKNIDNVLLSPCCASFDRYRSYAERGEKFKEIVYAINN